MKNPAPGNGQPAVSPSPASPATKTVKPNAEVATPWLDHGPLVLPIAPSGYFRWKGLLDRVLAAILLLPCIPLMVVLVCLVRLTSRGAGILQQVRVGRGGKLFTMYKIRSMVNNAETQTGPTWAQKNDPRVTLVGKFLRRAHLDELPQLFNVVRGEMSLVGPRPERPEFTDVLRQCVPGYMERLAVLPGITGLAQVNLPPDEGLDCVRRKVHLDREYVRTATLMMDLWLLVATGLKLAGEWGIHGMRLMGIYREVHLPNDDEIDSALAAITADKTADGQVAAAPVGAALTNGKADTNGEAKSPVVHVNGSAAEVPASANGSQKSPAAAASDPPSNGASHNGHAAAVNGKSAHRPMHDPNPKPASSVPVR